MVMKPKRIIMYGWPDCPVYWQDLLAAIGERLARLATRTQLLAVTHSPQVAAKGKAHYFIAKSSQGTVTRTGVALLDAEARRQEIARMLSGAEITDEARAQAVRLLEAI
jgi:DNA repair protein RecN (Recombination protein N)